MRKIKFAIASLLGVIAVVLSFALIARINAATLTYGTCNVSTTNYVGDTKTWDFTTNLPTSNTNINVGDNINGIVTSKDGAKDGKAAKIQIKNSATNGYDTYPEAEFLVPVPSASSTGTVTRTGNANNSRYLALGSHDAVALASPMTFDFTTSDVLTNPTLSNSSTATGYYLKFVVSGGEAKTFSISVQLKDGETSYGGATPTYTISYQLNGGTNPNNAPTSALDGSTVTLPTPTREGYVFDGWTLSGSDSTTYTSYTMNGSNVTFVANWTEGTVCNITYALQGGTNGSNPTTSIAAGNSFTLPLPSYGKKVFVGWLCNLDSQIYMDESYTPTEDVTFTAQWKDRTLPSSTNSRYILNADNLSTGDIKSNQTVAGTIYTLINDDDKYMIVDTQTLTYSDTLSYSNRLKFGGTPSTTGRLIKISAPTAGKLNVIALSGNNDNIRSINFSTIENNSLKTKASSPAYPGSNSKLDMITFNISEKGDYYLSSGNSGVNVYYVEFIPAIKALQQEAYSGSTTYKQADIDEFASGVTYYTKSGDVYTQVDALADFDDKETYYTLQYQYTWVRFVFIISGNTELVTSDFENDLTLILDEGGNNKELSYSPGVYDRLVLNGDTYSAILPGSGGTQYTFDNSINQKDIYVVFVVKFTTASYEGHAIKASLEVDGINYTTSGYTFI